MSFLPTLDTLRGLLLLAIGFGFVVFWHELGHFLAAKWAGVKVEQFAVGFGQAVLAWRKGLGLRVGTTNKEFKRRVREHLQAAEADTFTADPDRELGEMEIARGAKALGVSETEYRLNWIPLGGYVKMLGQDDLKPNSEAEDPRAFNRQTIGKRMVIVSAGVIMNVILAAFGFVVLFLIGFHVPPAQIGTVLPQSPAQQAGLQVGDRILSIAGKAMHDDWTKVELATALADPAEPTAIEVERTVNGRPQRLTIQVQPRMGSGATKDILRLGIGAAYELKGMTDKKIARDFAEQKGKLARLLPADALALQPGDKIVAVNGRPISVDDFAGFDAAVQASAGRPVTLTVRGDDGKGPPRDISTTPRLAEPFEGTLNFAGMIPRVQVDQLREGSPALGEGDNGLLPGDVVEAVTTGKERSTLADPVLQEFRKRVNDAGRQDAPIEVNILRDGRRWTIAKLRTMKIDSDGTRGFGFSPGYEKGLAVVADTLDGSAAAKAGFPRGAKIVEVNGQPATTWADVHARLLAWAAEHPAAGNGAAAVPVTFETAAGGRQTKPLAPSPAELDALKAYRYWVGFSIPFEQPRTAVRKATGPVEAVKWGVTETWDFTLQFYLTLHRMVTGGVSARNLMGPVGIFQAGTGFATRGADWLIWFLAMISANLAVVNFLPIPIVDGGLFTFLVLEKIKGKPLSAKTQAVAQYVGLALLLGIFLFVTYQDVINFQFRMR